VAAAAPGPTLHDVPAPPDRALERDGLEVDARQRVVWRGPRRDLIGPKGCQLVITKRERDREPCFVHGPLVFVPAGRHLVRTEIGGEDQDRDCGQPPRRVLQHPLHLGQVFETAEEELPQANTTRARKAKRVVRKSTARDAAWASEISERAPKEAEKELRLKCLSV